MNKYLAGTNISFNVVLSDFVGDADIDSASYKVYDSERVEVIAETSLSDASTGEVEIVVPASANQLPLGQVVDVRSVQVLITTINQNVVPVSIVYAVQSSAPLQLGLNSFQGYEQACLNSTFITSLSGWSSAGEQEKVTALQEAFSRISRIGFYIGDLTELNPEEYECLPSDFIKALRLAQVSEADALLGGEGASKNDGVILDVVGESRQAYRDSKPLDLLVSKRTMRYLSKFISVRKLIGRA